MLIKNRRIPIKTIILIGILPSFLKIIFYKLKGYKIGSDVKIGFGSIILGNNVSIGNHSKIGFLSTIICKNCIIDNHVEVGSFVYINVDKIKIGHQTVIRENNKFGGLDIGKSELSIGYLSHVHQNCTINTTMPVSIGNNTAIGGGSYIFTHSSWQSFIEGYPCTFKPVSIGNNVWISWDVFILPSVSIGDGTMVSAGSIVTKNLPERCLASGNPAKPIIPSGMYPREPHPDERNEKILDIIKSFAEFITNKDLICELNNQDTFIEYIVHNKAGKLYNLIFLFNPDNLIPEKLLTKNSVILIDHPLDKAFCDSMKNSGIPIINTSTGFVHLENSLSQEIVKFLRHYGIRLKKDLC